MYIGDIRVGPELDLVQPLSSSAGYIAGGETISINGRGFDDNWITGDTVIVTFDDVEVVGTIENDETITVTVPRGEMNQNAEVNVYFDSGKKLFYLHALQTYHYGPIVDEITTPCVDPRGGTPVTIVGRFLDDVDALSNEFPRMF